MAVRIRLQRKGAKHRAFYRIVAADSRSPRDGRFIEQLGYYDPLKEPADISVDTEKVLDWLSKGAKPTETVKSLFSRVGIMETWHEVRQGKSYDELHHIEDPNIGIYGMDVTVALIKPGYRIGRRKIGKRKIPNSHRMTKQDAMAFINEYYGVEVVA